MLVPPLLLVLLVLLVEELDAFAFQAGVRLPLGLAAPQAGVREPAAKASNPLDPELES